MGGFFFDASLSAWYRTAHSYLYGVRVRMAAQTLNYVVLGLMAFEAGILVMEKQISMGQFTALLLCVRLLADVQASIVGALVSLCQAHPSLRRVAVVFNTSRPQA